MEHTYASVVSSSNVFNAFAYQLPRAYRAAFGPLNHVGLTMLASTCQDGELPWKNSCDNRIIIILWLERMPQ